MNIFGLHDLALKLKNKQRMLVLLFIFFIQAAIVSEAYAADTTIKGTTVGDTVVALDVTDSGGTSLLCVRNDGTVGIGTTSPNQELTIEGTMSLKEQADADANTAAYGQIWVNTAAPNELWFTDDADNDTQLGTAGQGKVDVYLTGDQNVTGESNIFVTVAFDAESFDVDGDFSTGQYTCPATGKYLVSCQIGFGGCLSDVNIGMAFYNVTNSFDVFRYFGVKNQTGYESVSMCRIVTLTKDKVYALRGMAVDGDYIFLGSAGYTFLSIARMY